MMKLACTSLLLLFVVVPCLCSSSVEEEEVDVILEDDVTEGHSEEDFKIKINEPSVESKPEWEDGFRDIDIKTSQNDGYNDDYIGSFDEVEKEAENIDTKVNTNTVELKNGEVLDDTLESSDDLKDSASSGKSKNKKDRSKSKDAKMFENKVFSEGDTASDKSRSDKSRATSGNIANSGGNVKKATPLKHGAVLLEDGSIDISGLNSDELRGHLEVFDPDDDMTVYPEELPQSPKNAGKSSPMKHGRGVSHSEDSADESGINLDALKNDINNLDKEKTILQVFDGEEYVYITLEQLMEETHQAIKQELRDNGEFEKLRELEAKGRNATDYLVTSLLEADDEVVDDISDQVDELELMERQGADRLTPAQFERSRDRLEEKLQNLEKDKMVGLLSSFNSTDERVEEAIKKIRGEPNRFDDMMGRSPGNTCQARNAPHQKKGKNKKKNKKGGKKKQKSKSEKEAEEIKEKTEKNNYRAKEKKETTKEKDQKEMEETKEFGRNGDKIKKAKEMDASEDEGGVKELKKTKNDVNEKRSIVKDAENADKTIIGGDDNMFDESGLSEEKDSVRDNGMGNNENKRKEDMYSVKEEL